MKKLFIIVLIFVNSTAFAIDESCFRYKGDIVGVENKTIKVLTDNVNNYYFQDKKLLNTKILSNNVEYKYFDFLIDGQKYSNYSHSFEQYNNLKQITIKFPATLKKDTFDYILSSNNSNYHFEISKDGTNWNKIDDDIKRYDLDYIKIIFDNVDLKNTTIYSLRFFEDFEDIEILVNSTSFSDIKVFNEYICSDSEVSKILQQTKKTQYFPIDINTKTYHLSLESNPVYNEAYIINYLNRDTDGDGIIDTEDNCWNDYNPTQLDSTANGVGDICSDKDNDDIFGNIDNCTTVYNPNQVDLNKNAIGDDCEIDTDKDLVFDSSDNCINISNIDQLDTDGDTIGDSCDNCSIKSNLDQNDIDKDKIGDICDNKDDRYIESNKNFFIGMLLSFISLFLIGIFFMFKKLKKSGE